MQPTRGSPQTGPSLFRRAVRTAASVVALPTRAAALVRRSRITRAGVLPVLGFGGVLDDGRPVHGGAVKLLTLRDAFPCDERKFSVLYAVSSAQPPFAGDLVKQCRALGIRLVWNQNGVGYPAWAGEGALEVNASMQHLRSQANFVIYQSEFCRRCADKFLGLTKTGSQVLMNPVDLKFFAPPQEPLSAKPLRMLAMGTQNYPARALHGIDAAGELLAGGIDCHLTLAGTILWKGGEAEVAAHVRKAGLEGRFLRRGSFGRQEAAELCRSHHILLHPKYMDPCPTVVAEALASGLPVVGSASGGLPEMVDAACGVLLPVEETWEELLTPSGKQLAQAVADLAERWPEASAAARARAELLFDQTAWIEAHAKIFHSLGVPPRKV